MIDTPHVNLFLSLLAPKYDSVACKIDFVLEFECTVSLLPKHINICIYLWNGNRIFLWQKRK